MGGFGSGGWYRWRNKKAKVTNYYPCDISDLIAMLNWSTEGKPVTLKGGFQNYGEILGVWLVDEVPETKMLKFRMAGMHKTTHEICCGSCIYTTMTKPHYVGKRWWWLCPIDGCGKRVKKLYLKGARLRCRCCLKASYPSQSESRPYRLLRKLEKIYKGRFGVEYFEDYPKRPKYMKMKTYEYFCEEVVRLADLAGF